MTSIPANLSLTRNSDNHNNWRWVHHNRSPQRPRQTSILSHRRTEKECPGRQLGRLGSSVHHAHVDEDIDLPLLDAYSEPAERRDRHVSPHRIHGSIYVNIRLPVFGHL